MSKLIIGCGYVGRRLAEHWIRAGETVWATTRNDSRAKEFSALGIKPIVLDVTDGAASSLPEVETVVFAVGFDRSGPHAIEEVYVEGLRRILAQCPHSVRRFIYLSSTGVYGQTSGDWVDEETACQPTRAGGKACLAAEQLLMQHETFGERAIILRLAGIYGPDRLPQVAMLRRGEPLPVAADGQLNLIHVDDIVQIVALSEALSTPVRLCVSDGTPVRRAEFYEYLATLLELEPPQFVPPEPGSARAARARGSKRIRNSRLIEMLNPTFRYASYKAGLEAIVADE